jgi:hypothetical protein
MVMTANSRLQSAAASLAFLLAAGLLAWLVVPPARSPVLSGTSRTSLTAQVVNAEGEYGRTTLRLFGEDAADLFATNRAAFHDLVAVARLDAPAREISAGPWRDAVVQWGRAGRLGPYLDHVRRLGPDHWELLRRVPGCLPLLGRGARVAETMLKLHGEGAWRLFRVVDCADDVEGVERVARALALHGDSMLRVNESHGPLLALLFVPPSGDASGVVPALFVEASHTLGTGEAGALFLANYDDVARLVLEEGYPPDEVAEVFRLLAGQPEVVRGLASDSGLIVRLLLEHRGREPIGVEILSRCGPEAADLLFEKAGYARHPEEKAAALAILAHQGWPGVELLRALRDDAAWHHLLRRPELMDADQEPLIVRLAGKLNSSSHREDDVARYLDMPRAQIVEEDLPPTLSGQALEWVPGYLAVHTSYNAVRGYRVETSEAAWAVLDGLAAATFYGKLAGQAIKTIGRQAAKAEIQAAARGVERDALRKLAAGEVDQATRSLSQRMPAAFDSLTKILPEELPRMDVTQVMRAASGVAKKVGVRTWGKLDRRIIMRGDRMIVFDPFNPAVVSQVRQEVKRKVIEELQARVVGATSWQADSAEAGVLGPCILERVLPGLSIPAQEQSPKRSPEYTVPVALADLRADVSPQFGVEPIMRIVGGAALLLCLALAVPGMRRTVGRVCALRSRASGSNSSRQKPRPYRE